MWHNFKSAVAHKLAWQLPPLLVYWAAVRLMTHAAAGADVGDPHARITCKHALELWRVR